MTVKLLSKWEVVASVVIPVLTSLLLYAYFAGSQTSRLTAAEHEIVRVDEEGTRKLVEHIVEDTKADSMILQRLARIEGKLDVLLESKSTRRK